MRKPADRSTAKPKTLALIEELEFFAAHTGYSLNDVCGVLQRTPEALLALAQKYSCQEAYSTLLGRNNQLGKVTAGAIRL